jgi:hypothetical protein
MALNPYFLNGSSSEQRLIQDLVNEQIRTFGQDIVYMPRKFITEKKIIKELLVSKFDDSFHLEAYVATPDGFGGQGDILSKFGVRSTDEITFIISRERFEDFILPFIVTKEDIKNVSRPQEGDLIYFPLDNALFEIKYVEAKRPFYQLNNLYVYELKCELFEYEDEIIDTGNEEVDASIKDFGYTATLTMVGEGATAAELQVSLAPQIGKSVSYIDIVNGGYGYKSPPKVIISPAPSGGQTATAVAVLRTIGTQSTIDNIQIINPGFGYTAPPEISIISNDGAGFIGNCMLNTGCLGEITIINRGSQYSTAPTVSISTSPTGDNAEVITLLDASGRLSSVRYLNVGSGYVVSPTISIESPSGISTGNYKYNEIITGTTSGSKAYVRDWHKDTRTLKVSIINGRFKSGETVVGDGAEYKVLSFNTDDLYDSYASNDDIQELSDKIIDFSEKNPFGEF